MSKEYYIGLDMGTSSCGWAVTDTEYRLLRAKGKDMWGVRLFPEAETAAGRRTFRVSRRRLERRKRRIGYLKEYFSAELEQVDPNFLHRLDESKYHLEDKSIEDKYILFSDKDYTDADYYKEYPTVFHLRSKLLHSDEKMDIRLIYLAILNMFKHRGHFLNTTLGDGEIGDLKELYQSMREMSEESLGKSFVELASTEKLEEILASKDYSNTGKWEQLLDCLGINKTKNKVEAEMLRLVCGLTGKIPKIFENDTFDEDGLKLSLSFRDGNYEEKCAQVEQTLSEESFELFLTLKQIHDWGVLANIMKGKEQTYDYLSDARVDSYEKHAGDLAILKAIYKEFLPDKYYSMFRKMQKNNYSAYVGSSNYGTKKERRVEKASVDDFYKKIKKDLQGIKTKDDNVEYVLQELEKGTFLPKQLTSANGVIPNQVHKKELRKILSNAEKHYPFLLEKDESGLTVSERIVKLFEFQIPYYVGPLANVNGKGNGWAVRKETGAVMPWNFEQKMDVKASAEKFIEKMINHCTYLNSEEVLPKNSLLYEKFVLLNELNNLRINGDRIDPELKQALYNDLFTSGKKITVKKLIDYLKIHNVIDTSEDYEISGIDGGFTNTLSNYRKFCDVFGTERLTYEQQKMAEAIIRWSTVYGDSKKFLKEKIEEAYGDQLSKKQMKRILGFKFKDWGRLSKEFLQLEGADCDTGEAKTIIARMWDEQYNLMELLSNRFTYLNAIEEKATKLDKTLSEIKYEDLEDLYISAPVRRMTWQTILILKEIHQIMGCDPKRIFVEMARDPNAEKKRTVSRKNKFLELYKSCKKESRDWMNELKNTDESKFKSKKLYLYYTQKGRCMYTGEPIDLDALFNDNLYDIDHIYPRHFTKDDSLENNLVLVKKEKNAHKSDAFPIEGSIRSSQHAFWKTLLDGDFITKEKYNRLTRNTEFTDDELANFVSRQIVETRQGTKVIANLFEKTFPDSDVVYVKAGNVSQFRNKFDFIKCRAVNDFHHANDAYLNIVVGNAYYVKFTKNPYNFIKAYRKDSKSNQYHMYKLFEYTIANSKEVAWKVKDDASIDIVKKMMGKNTPLVTRMNYEESGGLADQTIYPARDAEKAKGVGYLPVKATDGRILDTMKYGGFKKFTGAYFFLVEQTVKKKRIRTLEPMPLYLKDQLDTVEKMEEYCKQQGMVDPRICYKKIKMYSKIKVDGFELYLTGRSGVKILVSNAVEMKLEYSQAVYIKHLVDINQDGLNHERINKDERISREENLQLYTDLVEKHKVKIYSRRPNPVGDKLCEWTNKFKELSIDRQVYVLLQILQLSALSNQGADLSEIGGVKKTGVATLNKKISDKREFKLINESVTGIYRTEIDLLTV